MLCLEVHGNYKHPLELPEPPERDTLMSPDSAGSITRDAADLRSPDALVREQAARRIWERFEPRLLELVRRRLNPRIRVRADEDDLVQSMFKSFFAIGHDGDRAPPADREELWRLLVWMAMCKIANTAHKHHAMRRDVRREDPQAGSPELSGSKLAGWMAELEDRDSLTPQEAAVFHEEFDRLLCKLPEQLQQIFVWKLQGHTNAEIGRMINRTERTVELKMQIIRKTLEQDLMTRSGSGA
jgi:RNA polymerase sigma-70 factor, ECF subfamily